ncbi:unnamed protein product [Parnassius apollo]|uniref:(apollo) hypothetical protein n=1 Tax=Parnassius apollo TaxID=110799 RepID=A0A8S3X8C2_PARAO|nr:unnamed protein product [Parnassius apollo]
MPSSLKTTKASEETEDAAAVDLNNSNVMYLLLILVCHPLVLVIKIPSKVKKMSQSILLRWFIMKLKKRKQSTLVACLERGSSFEEGGQKHSEITQALIYMICKDNLPLSCVEKKGLQKLMRTACPIYKLPSRKKALECQEKAPSEEGLGYKVVLKLTKNVPAGSLVVFDNFFTSIPLIEILYERNIYSVGTVRLTRKGMPEEST